MAGGVLVVGVLVAGLLVWHPWLGHSPVHPRQVADASAAPATTQPHPTTEPMTSPAPEPTSFALPDYSSATAVHDGLIVYPTGSHEFAVQVPGEPAARSFPAPEPGPGQEIVGSVSAVTGNADRPLLAVLLILRTPADGLTPEKYTTQLRTYNRDSPNPVAETTIPEIVDKSTSSLSVSGTSSGGVVVGSTDPLFFAAGTLKKSGTAIGAVRASSGTVVITTPYTWGDSTCKATAWSTETGAKLWTRDLLAAGSYADCEFQGDDRMAGFTVNIGRVTRVIDARTGQNVSPELAGAKSVLFDPVEPLVAVAYSTDSSSPGPGLQIFDATTWKAVLTVDAARAEALDLETYSLYGGNLYISNTDADPVIDARTGAKVASRWSFRPVASVNDDWTIVERRSGSSGSSSYVLVANSAGKYAGPWW